MLPNGTVEFKCQHGQREVKMSNNKKLHFYNVSQFQCDVNKFQSCALFLYPDPDVQAEIIFCTMKPRHKNYEDCIEELKLDGENIYRCTNGTLGTILQLRAEVDSLKMNLQGVPTVVYNGKMNSTDFDLSLSDFGGVVASKLNNQTRKAEFV